MSEIDPTYHKVEEPCDIDCAPPPRGLEFAASPAKLHFTFAFSILIFANPFVLEAAQSLMTAFRHVSPTIVSNVM